MNKVMQGIGTFLVIMGIVAMAGAGGDCDGKCGAGNSLTDMLMIVSIGLALFGTGAVILIKGDA